MNVTVQPASRRFTFPLPNSCVSIFRCFGRSNLAKDSDHKLCHFLAVLYFERASNLENAKRTVKQNCKWLLPLSSTPLELANTKESMLGN